MEPKEMVAASQMGRLSREGAAKRCRNSVLKAEWELGAAHVHGGVQHKPCTRHPRERCWEEWS